MAPVDRSYYDLLGVKPDATPAQLRKAFRLKALQLHPDRNSDAEQATQAFQHLNAIYNILSDADKRAHYDQFGPADNPHADDAAAAFDASSLAEFLARASSRLSAEDISAYEHKYRQGDEEREDLEAFYRRFEGQVVNVLQYIPYSAEGDLSRFVAFWDARIEAKELQSTSQYVAAREVLLQNARKYESKQNAASADGGGGGGGVNKGGKKRAKTRKNGQSGDMEALAALIQKRALREKGRFEEWCDGIEKRCGSEQKQKDAKQTRSSSRPSRSSRSTRSTTARGAQGTKRGAAQNRGASSSSSRGVRKQRKASR